MRRYHLPTLISKIEINTVNVDWQKIWANIGLLKAWPRLHDIMYKIVHNIYPTKYLLFSKQIVANDACTKCRKVETLKHKLTDCKNKQEIWNYYKRILRRVTEGNSSHYTFTQLINCPEYKVVSKAKCLFMMVICANRSYSVKRT